MKIPSVCKDETGGRNEEPLATPLNAIVMVDASDPGGPLEFPGLT
jgi:hypothetical protein